MFPFPSVPGTTDMNVDGPWAFPRGPKESVVRFPPSERQAERFERWSIGVLIGDIGNAYLYVDHRFGGKARNCRGADLIDAESNVA
ncbi:MAG: hypothetical protein QOH48_357 [Actinomycetota bacterium]|jgi:hypothetical protein|nr:hypothetical protein [Actinomycetota bacterium]